MTSRDKKKSTAGWHNDRRLCLIAVLLVWLTLALSGCNQVTRHKVLTTLFDGVPSLPPVDEMCIEYTEQLAAAPTEASVQAAADLAASAPKKLSHHRPFMEKRCSDCHAQDKPENEGFVAPKRDLCFVCHDKSLIAGSNVHGPVAVGDCLACHLPHDSKNASLLIFPNGSLCANCHQEQRLASSMHQTLAERHVSCTECHDPHAGDTHYFLK
ncbi:cytochrome c3 family protein [Desulfuromonas sp.]|uniref:cytochrome c3 family protein n=1 Tax=Desulfuromonas sp. TaxID=892 RepID=UPI0025C51BFE|nr:cytochrome c3 family protein [Desulfuromonas sp.]